MDVPLSSTPSEGVGQFFLLEKGLVSTPSELCKLVFFLSVTQSSSMNSSYLESGPPRMGGFGGSLLTPLIQINSSGTSGMKGSGRCECKIPSLGNFCRLWSWHLRLLLQPHLQNILELKPLQLCGGCVVLRRTEKTLLSSSVRDIGPGRGPRIVCVGDEEVKVVASKSEYPELDRTHKD